MDWHCFDAKPSCVKSYLGCCPAVLLDPVGSRLRHETLWIHFQTFEYNLLSVWDRTTPPIDLVQHYVVQYCSRRLYFRPPEEYIGFMNKYRILSPGSRNSYLQHSINSNLKLAKTSSRGKFATLSKIKHDLKSNIYFNFQHMITLFASCAGSSALNTGQRICGSEFWASVALRLASLFCTVLCFIFLNLRQISSSCCQGILIFS